MFENTTYTIAKCCLLLMLWIMFTVFSCTDIMYFPHFFLAWTIHFGFTLRNKWSVTTHHQFHILTYHEFHLLINLFNCFWRTVVCGPGHVKKNRRVSASAEPTFWKLSTDSKAWKCVVEWAVREGPTEPSCDTKGMQLALLEGLAEVWMLELRLAGWAGVCLVDSPRTGFRESPDMQSPKGMKTARCFCEQYIFVWPDCRV